MIVITYSAGWADFLFLKLPAIWRLCAFSLAFYSCKNLNSFHRRLYWIELIWRFIQKILPFKILPCKILTYKISLFSTGIWRRKSDLARERRKEWLKRKQAPPPPPSKTQSSKNSSLGGSTAASSKPKTNKECNTKEVGAFSTKANQHQQQASSSSGSSSGSSSSSSDSSSDEESEDENQPQQPKVRQCIHSPN